MNFNLVLESVKAFLDDQDWTEEVDRWSHATLGTDLTMNQALNASLATFVS